MDANTPRVEATAAAATPRVEATAVGAAECVPLLDLATPEMYLRNPFRVLGLGITASTRAVAREFERRRLMAELQQPAGGATGSPVAAIDELRAAEAILHEPQRRLIYELFWFWPLNPEEETDPALSYVLQGELRAAAEIWEGVRTSPNASEGKRAAAVHNLAIAWHWAAVDLELQVRGHAWQHDDQDLLRKAWATALQDWSDCSQLAATWNALLGRALARQDDRVGVSFVQSIRGTIGKALLQINAQLVLRHADRGHRAAADRQLAVMLAAPQCAQDRSLLDGLLTRPIRTRVREQIAVAARARSAAPQAGPEHVTNLMSACSIYRSLLTQIENPEAVETRDRLGDDVGTESLATLGLFPDRAASLSLRALRRELRSATQFVTVLKSVHEVARSPELSDEIQRRITGTETVARKLRRIYRNSICIIAAWPLIVLIPFLSSLGKHEVPSQSVATPAPPAPNPEQPLVDAWFAQKKREIAGLNATIDQDQRAVTNNRAQVDDLQSQLAIRHLSQAAREQMEHRVVELEREGERLFDVLAEDRVRLNQAMSISYHAENNDEHPTEH